MPKKAAARTAPAKRRESAYDEDIDDDLAFDSEDEKKYGAFFGKEPVEAAPEEHDFGDSDDSRDEIDISELLDSKEDRRKNRGERRSERTRELTAAERRKALQQQGESVVSDPHSTRHAHASLVDLVAATAKSASSGSRISKLTSTEGLIGVAVDEDEKLKTDRQATRDRVQEDMKKWKSHVREQKSGKALSFPLKAPNQNPVPTTLGGVASTSRENRTAGAGTQLGGAMSEILAASGMSGVSSSDPEGFVPLPGAAGAEEVDDNEPANDRSYVAKLKALVGYELAKRRRFNKIKSKAYRRILRKEKERTREVRQRALELIDPEAARRKNQERMEKMRAEERATQRHKNTSKWVKHVKGMSKIDDDTKEALQEQNLARARLMAKAQEDAADDIVPSTDSDDDAERRVDELLTGTDVRSMLWTADDAGAEPDDPLSKAKRALYDMQFMKKARATQQTAFDAEVTAFATDIERHNAGLPPLGVDTTENADADGDGDRDAADDVDADPLGLRATTAKARAAKAARLAAAAEQQAHRHALAESAKAGSGRKKFESDPGSKRDRVDVGCPTPQGILAGEDHGRLASAKRNAKDRHEKRARTQSAAQAAAAEPPSVSHDYLIARAFAKDDVDEDFTAQKAAQVEDAMKPEDANASLPGWGEWGGEHERLNVQHQTRVAELALKRNIERTALARARADAGLDHAIINHEVSLVPDKHTLHLIPRPFDDAEQYSRSVRQPLGPEWNTPTTFNDGVAPRVSTRRGVVIDPVDATTGVHRKASTSRRKRSEREGARAPQARRRD